MDDPYFLEPHLIRRSFNAASATFDAHAVLHSEVRARALDRLQLLRQKPNVIVDLGAGTGHASQALKKRFPSAQVLAIDSAMGMLQTSRAQQGWLRRFVPIASDAAALPLRSASVDWVFSNLMLPWASFTAVVNEVRRVLKPGGVFSFTTLGPDTLKELRRAWPDTDLPHVHGFIDMHDLGDALVHARFAEPVLDVEQFTLTYPSVIKLIDELRATGAMNLSRGRRRSLTGRTRWQTMLANYEQQRTNGKIPASIEVVYGQAWRPLQELAAKHEGESLIPLSSIGRRSRS